MTGLGRRSFKPALALLAAGAALALAAIGPARATHEPEPVLRTAETHDGAVIRLEVVARTFQPTTPDAPTVTLAGAVHIGDPSFYDALQSLLDSHEIVLYEGVRPPGAGQDPESMTDDQRVRSTQRRIQFLASAIELFRAEHGRYPVDLSELAAGLDRKVGSLIDPADAWGRPFIYTLDQPDAPDPGAAVGGFELISLGADGREGGEGPDADIALADLPDPAPGLIAPDGPGLQARLAESLGLVFQLDAMDHSGPHWRNSDMSVDQIMDRLDGSGAMGDELFRTLGGSSPMARVAGGLVRLVGALPASRTLLKLALIDTLEMADDVLGSVPGPMAELVRILIEDRNKLVIDDLKRLIETEPNIRTVGIIYGAGHLPDLEQRLVALGYTPAADRWLPAIEVDLRDAGISIQQAQSLRAMLRRSMQAQLEQAR
jgi:hypothetical protein